MGPFVDGVCAYCMTRTPAPHDEPDEAITPFDPPYDLKCPHCDGVMWARVMRFKTRVLLECQGECKRVWQAPVARVERAVCEHDRSCGCSPEGGS